MTIQAPTEQRELRDGIVVSSAMDEYLRCVAPYLAPSLVAPSSSAAMSAVAALLPAASTTDFGFECRLGVEAAAADLCVCLSVAGRGREILAGLHAGIPAPTVLATDPRWLRLGRFIQEWADPSSPLYNGADHVWLEFDVAESGPGAPSPNVLFSPQFLGWTGAAIDDGHQVSASAARAVRLGIEALSGGPLAAATARVLADCVRLLPSHACIFSVGVMTARTPAPVRLSISGLAMLELADCLERLGWDGDVDALVGLHHELRRLVDDITFNLDLDGAVGPKIGLECYVRDRRPRAPLLVTLLDHLVGAGLCLPTKRDALFAYPGVSTEQTDPSTWPPSLARAAGFLGGRIVPVLSRYVHHLKVVFANGRAQEAKAYLGGAVVWLDRAPKSGDGPGPG